VTNAKWWMNRLGKFAPASNPGSAVPNYGLTFDIATAPWDSNAQFEALAQSEDVVSRVLGVAGGLVRNVTRPAEFVPGREGGGNFLDEAWSASKAAAGAVGGALTAGVGAVDTVADWFGADATLGSNYEKLSRKADKMGLTGYDRLKFIGSADLGKAGENLGDDQVASKLFWALDKVSEGAATTFAAGTEAGNNPFAMFDEDTWERAHAKVRKFDLNAGEGFVSMFYDKEILDDESRFREIRANSGVFNFAALTFNVVGAWKFDPSVLAAKGAGKVRDMRAGVLADGGRAAEVQRDILAAPTRGLAEERARGYTGMADRVRANRGLTLFDKAENLRKTALTAKDPNVENFGYEQFKRLAPFTNSPSGVVLSKLLYDVADDDDAWNLVFRASIGDTSAIDELHFLEQGVTDKLNALELGRLPVLESEFDAVSKRFEARLEEQGGKVGNDDRLIITSSRDYFLQDDYDTTLARLTEAKEQFAGYKEHESWWTRAAEGTHEGANTKVNTVFNTLGQVNPARGHRESLGDLASKSIYGMGGKWTTFRKDEYGRLGRVITTPAKPFLKRTGVVNLTHVEEGADAVAARLDQIAYFKGVKDPNLRSDIMGRWAASTSEVDRKNLVESLDRQGMDVVFRKHGITNPKVREAAIDLIQNKRMQGWQIMSDTTRYTTAKDRFGQRLDKRHFFQDVDDRGVKTDIAIPMDPTELPNWHPFMNLTDLDRTLSRNKDRLIEISREADIEDGLLPGAKTALTGKRWMQDLGIHVGETFNTYWKPAALLSLRWPARVVTDESLRVILFLGAAVHAQSGLRGAGNILHNTGFTKPFEWAKGRIVKTGLAEDSLRVGSHAYDPFDARVIDNPQAAVRADSGLFDGADARRQAKLLEQQAEARTWLRKGQAGVKPKFAQRYDDRVAALEKSDTRGFFFDPATGKARNKGFAVSPYPGRMRSFDKKPSAAEMHWFTEKNTDLLSIPDNQVAVWLDKDNGRWVIDVVRTARRREDAMVLAYKAGAADFFDINQGFTRVLADEDPYGHARFAAEGPETAPGGDTPVVSPEAVTGRPGKRRIGVGVQAAKTADGKTVGYEDVYGVDSDNLNIFFSAHSSKGMFERIHGGYTKGLGDARIRRSSKAPVPIHPGDLDDKVQAKAWGQAQSEYVNKHFRKSPIWLRMLNGQTDDQIEKWLTSTPEGRRLRVRMGKRAVHPGHWVDDMRAIFDHTLPTAEARLAAKAGDITPDQWDDLIPHAARNDVHGDDILLAQGMHQAQSALRGYVDKAMGFLAAAPTDALVRHPFAANLYNQRMRNYLASVDSDSITPKVMAAAESSARAYATKEVSRLLYNMADEGEAMHMLRFMSPFIQAQIEVLERYARLFTTKPESLVRFAQLYFLSQQQNEDRGLWYMVDADGNPTDKFSNDNKMVIRNTDFVKALSKRIPGLKALGGGEMAVPVSSINMVFQGDTPYIPSAGPLVTVPATEFYYKDRPFAADEDSLRGQVFRMLFPYGTPQGETAAGRVTNAMAPAWTKRLMTVLSDNFDDSAYATFASRRFTDLQYEWEQENGRPLPQRLVAKLEEQAHEQTKAWWLLRAFSSFSLPVPIEGRSPYQFWYDQAAKYRRKYGLEADRKFYEDMGADFFKFFTESSKANMGLAPTSGSTKAFQKYRDLMKQAPELASVIAGPVAQAGEFNYEAYRWQFRTRTGGALSKGNIRDTLSPEERITENQVNRGWIEYSKLAAAVDAELRNRGLVTSGMTEAQQNAAINRSAAEDLLRWKQAKVAEIIDRNPAWQEAYRSRADNLSGWLNQANTVVFDKRLDGRTDIEGLRAYMISRDKVQAMLQQRLANGLSGSLTAETNADLAGAWDSYVEELTSKNLLFAELYHRWLETDDLSVIVTD